MLYVFVLVGLLFITFLTLSWAYALLPLEELRRRARSSARDTQIYKVASKAAPLKLLLWLIISALSITLIIMASRWAWWAGAVTGLVVLWLIANPIRIRPDGLVWWFSSTLSPAVWKVLDVFMPLLSRPAKLLMRPHTNRSIFEKEDLIELINELKRSPNVRISSADLSVAASALKFSQIKVGLVMTPKKKVRFVSGSEVIGPKLMDELFATGFKIFPVVKGSAKSAQHEVIGTLELKTLLKKLEIGGKIESIASRHSYFINEDSSLPAALDAIVKHHHQLLVVVNNLGEIVGVISLEQILNRIIGELPKDEFEDHANLKAVARQTEDKAVPHDEPLAKRVVK